MKNEQVTYKIGMTNIIWINKYSDGQMVAFETKKQAMLPAYSFGAVRRGIKYVLPESAR